MLTENERKIILAILDLYDRLDSGVYVRGINMRLKLHTRSGQLTSRDLSLLSRYTENLAALTTSILIAADGWNIKCFILNRFFVSILAKLEEEKGRQSTVSGPPG